MINIRGLNTNALLSSQIPEVVLTAVLSDYQPEEAETILRKIVTNLKKLVKNKRVLKKYINQLVMLSRLRKIENLTIKITEEMPIHYDIETDSLYLKGTEKGLEKRLEKRLEKSVIKLWQKDIAPDMIANLLDLTIERVESIIAEYIRASKM